MASIGCMSDEELEQIEIDSRYKTESHWQWESGSHICNVSSSNSTTTKYLNLTIASLYLVCFGVLYDTEFDIKYRLYYTNFAMLRRNFICK